MENTMDNVQAQEAIPAFGASSEVNEVVLPAVKLSFWRKNGKKIILLAVVAVIMLCAGILFRITRADYVACQYARAVVLGDNAKQSKLFAVDLEKTLIYLYGATECYYEYSNESKAFRKNHDADEYVAEHIGKYDSFEYYSAKSEVYEQDIENWAQFCKAYKQERDDDLEETFGSYKVTAESRSDKMVRPSSFDELTIQVLEEMGLDWENIGKIKSVSVRVRIDGEYDRESVNYIVYLIRSGIGWKVIDSEDND